MKLRVVNHAPHARYAYASGTVPNTGDTPTRKLARIDEAGEVIPVFAVPSGLDANHLLVEFPLELEADSEKRIELVDAESVGGTTLTFAPWRMSDAVVRWLSSIPFQVLVDGEPVAFRGMELVSESTPFKKVFRYFATRQEPAERGADISLELITKCWSNHDIIDFDLEATIGTREENAETTPEPEIVFLVNNAGVRVNHGGFKLAAEPKVEAGATHLVLLSGRGGMLGDAQGVKISGAIICPGATSGIAMETLLAESVLPVLTVSTTWPSSARYGALGHVVPPPAWVKDPTSSAIENAVRAYRRGPFREPFGWFDHEQSLENPGGTGRQPGFGVSIAHDIAFTGRPERLLALHRDVEQEACRPTTFLDRFGAHFSADYHPSAFFWQDRPFYRDATNKSPDTLGRTFELPSWSCRASQRGMGWGGYDRQHYTPNALVFHALLTGDLWTRRRLRQQVERWIAAHRTDTGNPTVDGFEASRAVGRAMLWAAQAAFVLDHGPLRERLIATATARWEMILARYAERYGQAFDQLEVQPLDVLEPDTPPVNHQSDLYRHWNPWQEAMIPAAADAWVRILAGHAIKPRLREFAWRIARTVTLHGFHKAPEGWVMGVVGVEWFNGRAPAPSELRIGDNFDPYSGYTVWQLQAALLAEHWAQQRSDTTVQLAARRILEETLGRTIGDPLDPHEWHHDVLNHVAVVPNPWERLPMAMPAEAPPAPVDAAPQRVAFAAAIKGLG